MTRLLVVVILTAAVAVGHPLDEPKKADPPKEKAEFKLTEDEQAVLDATNAERKKEKLEPLTANPKLLDLWYRLCPKDKKDQRTTEYRWMEWVAEFHPLSQEAILAVAKVAIDHGMWGEAKAALVRAEKIRPSKNLYLLWIRLEEETNKNPDVIRQWLDRVSKAPQGAQWICSKTYRTFDEWVAVVEPEGFFNTLEWRDMPNVQVADGAEWLLKQA